MSEESNSEAAVGQTTPQGDSLREHEWPRFVRAPDKGLLEDLYVPALARSVRYDRCCAYFSSSVLAAASRGFARLISRLIALGNSAPHPAVRLVVNEQLNPDDVRALIETADASEFEQKLLQKLKNPRDLLEKDRLAMLTWLVKAGLLEIRVGLMRGGQGILHAKFGLIYDSTGDAIVFSGSGNESAQGLQANYECLEVSTSWKDEERFQEYSDEFERLWKDIHPDVHTITLPEAVRQQLIKLAPPDPPLTEPGHADSRRKAAMIWQFLAEAPYLPNGASTCDATAPLASLWPHQRHVIDEASSAWPDGRLLCDEVGMGKTIEAIMILRRLLAGRGVRRALLLLPAGLTGQWQEELREKGGLEIPRLQGADVLVWPNGHSERVEGLEAALKQDVLILSRETARTESNRATLLGAEAWDLVLMDEAHAARRAKQEEGEFNSATLLLDLLRQLQVSQKARGFQFLSATPMQTAPWEPWDLLAVLGEGGGWLSDFKEIRAYYNLVKGLGSGLPISPDDARRAAWLLSSDGESPAAPAGFLKPKNDEEGVTKFRFVPPALRGYVAVWLRQASPLARHMRRNTRRTLEGYYSQGLLVERQPDRRVADQVYDFQPVDGPERCVYDAVGNYIERRFEELEEEKPGKGFVMTIYRRRAVSSPHALRKSLGRRLLGLKRVIAEKAGSGYMEEIDAPEGFVDADLPEEIDIRSIPSSLPTNPGDARREAEEVERLLEQLSGLGAIDTKRDHFFNLIRVISGEGRPVLVFTEYTDTMEYVREALADNYGEQVASYCGKGGSFYRESGWKDASKKEITDALEKGSIRFLVCTDAASEGLNLQAASALINYDLPWNPSRVEQRIGRIDRIGQRERIVVVYNFFLKNSIDEKVYKALEARCGLFLHFVGPMQPVLARAKTMLDRPKEFSEQDLANLAKGLIQDTLISETYFDAEPSPIDITQPAVTKDDLMQSLLSLKELPDLSIKGETIVQIKIPGQKSVRVALDSRSLDEDPSLEPLTALSPLVSKIAKQLGRFGDLLPLVIGTHRKGPFRVSLAFWVGHSGFEPIATFRELKDRLGKWDGSAPNGESLLKAEKYASDSARKQVEIMASKAEQRTSTGLRRQVDAVRLRTARELGRLIKAIDPTALNLDATIAAQIARGGALAEKMNEAKRRLGPGFAWSRFLLWDLDQYANGLTANEQRSRLSGSSLDAALADYRWRAGAG